MARKAAIEKCRKPAKFKTRQNKRCMRCGRRRGYLRRFGLCRICFRKMALEGLIPGVVKASW